MGHACIFASHPVPSTLVCAMPKRSMLEALAAHPGANQSDTLMHGKFAEFRVGKCQMRQFSQVLQLFDHMVLQPISSLLCLSLCHTPH